MSWEKVKLGDITESCLGKMLDKNKNKGEYQPYLANINVRWGSFDLDDLQLMRFEESESERYGIKYGDLIICEGGEPGRCAIWKEQLPNMKIQKALHRVRVLPEKADPFYLFYWFLNAGQRNALDQYYTGATIKHMPGDKLKQVIIDLPDLPTQHRIASILSAYDDLIENNRRQIKLLEEAAQRLYREWFVELRFPGHEGVKVVDGVPEGWSIRNLSGIFDYVRGKSYTSAELCEDTGILMVNLKNIKAYGGYVRNAEKRFKGKFKMEQSLKAGDIVMAVTDMTQERRLVGHVAVVPNFGEQAIISMDLIKLIPKCVSSEYLYATLNYGEYSRKLSPFANGTNVLHLKPDSIMNLEMIVPSHDVISLFSQFMKSIQDKIEFLEKQSLLSGKARDLLLPKLMSGEMEVR